MRVEHFPYDYDLGARFSSRRRVFAFEGGSVYAAEVESTFYVIVDEGTQADFLLPSDRNGL